MRSSAAILTIVLCLVLFLLNASPILGQASYRITPNFVTMRIGEQRNSRMVDQNGRA